MNATQESPGLLPLSLRRVRLGKRYREQPPTNDDRMRAYRAATPLPEIAHPWPLKSDEQRAREYAASQEPQEPITDYAQRRGC